MQNSKHQRYTYSFEIGLDLDMTANGIRLTKHISTGRTFPLEKQESVVIQSCNPIDLKVNMQ